MWVEIAPPVPAMINKALSLASACLLSLSLSSILCAWGSEAEGCNVSRGGFKSAFHHM